MVASSPPTSPTGIARKVPAGYPDRMEASDSAPAGRRYVLPGERSAADFKAMSFSELAAESHDAVYPGHRARWEAERADEKIRAERLQKALSAHQTKVQRVLIGLLWASALAIVLLVVLAAAPWPEDRAASIRVFGSVVCFIPIVLTVIVALGNRMAAGDAARAVSEITSPTPRAQRSWRDAEHGAASWLRSRGEVGIRVGAGTRDGGVDVESNRYVVQVKDWKGNVGGPAVRQIAGVAAARGKTGVVVARNGFTADAIAFARQAGVELYVAGDGYRRKV